MSTTDKFLRQTGYFIGATTNGSKVIKQITQDLKENVDKYGERLLEKVCQIFVQLAQYNLLKSGYNVSSLVDNIFYTRYGKNKYRVGIRNNTQKPIMYFLEFGTGAVGRENQHPLAGEIGWEYLVNKHRTSNGIEGWTYYDETTSEYVFTRGLKAVSYIYDTLQEMPKIIEEAKRKVNLNE